MIDAGYFAKRIVPRPEEIHAPAVREIYSVSNCISSGPPGWLEGGLHNELGWFNTIADTIRMISIADREPFRLVAYRVAPDIHRAGTRFPLSLPASVRPEPIPTAFIRRGFDAVSKSMTSVTGLECSPLSCNYLAAELDTNEFCLFSSIEEATAGADTFSVDQPEPGDFYVVEVLEGQWEGRPVLGGHLASGSRQA